MQTVVSTIIFCLLLSRPHTVYWSPSCLMKFGQLLRNWINKMLMKYFSLVCYIMVDLGMHGSLTTCLWAEGPALA